jgi:peptidoglycan DL-endopeptidase CwlO
VAAVGVIFNGPALADSYDDQISALSQQAASAQAQANADASQITTYQQKLAQLNAQISSLSAQVQLNELQYTKVSADIAANEAKLASAKTDLGADIKAMYLASGVTPLEMIASSQNLSDFFNEQQYQDTIRGKIEGAMTSIEQLKTQLDAQQKQITLILNTEHAQQGQLATAQAQAGQLLALAQQNAAAANAQVTAANSQISSLRAQQAAMFARLAGATSGDVGTFTFRNLSFGGQCGGGYPGYLCNAPTDSSVDSWGMLNRECVSYAAYRVASSGRTMPNWGGSGDAYQWPADAAAAGIPESNSPQAGDVLIAPASMIGGVGHAMYVESIEDGGWVHVSQYNWWPTENGPYGLYSEMDVKVVPGLVFIHFH